MLLVVIVSIIFSCLSGTLATEEKPVSLPTKMNNTIFLADNGPRRSSGDMHVPLFIIRPMASHKIKTILPPSHYKSHSSHVHGLPEYSLKDKDVFTLERLLPMLGIYPNKIIYKNPEYSTAPKVQHIYLPVPNQPVYHHHQPQHHHEHHYQHYSHGKPQYLDYLPTYTPHRALHTTMTGSSDIGLKHVTPYNSDPPSIYHAPTKPGAHTLTSPVHIKTESHSHFKAPHHDFLPIQHHNHHQHTPYVHQHLTPAPIVKYLTPDHFIPIHPTLPSLPTHPHLEQKPHLHFYSAQDHSAEHDVQGYGPHLGSDGESDEHEHYHIGHRNSQEQQHADSLIHQIQAKQFTGPVHFPIPQQKPFPYETHYKVFMPKPPMAYNKPYDVKYRAEIKPPNSLIYPLAPPTFIKQDPNIKPVVEQAVEESLRRHQTQKPSETPKNATKDDDFKPILMPMTPMTPTNTTNAGQTYTAMPNKCEEKCNVETKTKDENSETVCGTNGKLYKNKTQFICAQKCGMKDLQSQPLNKCNPEAKS